MNPRAVKPVQVLIVGSVLFTFISFWRAAAIVLCDLASTAYYIGGIAEQFVGKAAPWFILGVMGFSLLVNRVYLESCSMFVRGGVYRVVKEAMGPFLGKLAVSALMFDYILTGPISSVSAGQYIVGLFMDLARLINPEWVIAEEAARTSLRNWGSVAIALLITGYFFWQNLKGIHESSEKALRILQVTAVMGVVMILWCLVTFLVRDPHLVNAVPLAPDLTPRVEYATRLGEDPITGERLEMYTKGPDGKLVPKIDPATGQPVPKINPITQHQEDPLGFLGKLFPHTAEAIRQPGSWLSLIGIMGLMIAFGHSLLAMSGMETMAQVYREVESPKMPNFKKAAWVIFGFSFVLTSTISFMAVMLIPDEVRTKYYTENLIGGLAMHVADPTNGWLRIGLNAFVVVVGFMLLSGAVNTSIIGSNGVLNRVAEDGVLPAILQKPHPKYGTTYRLLYLIVGMQVLTILVSRGDTIILGEAYAFGVVWSFTFKAMSMVVLRFTDKSPREAKVPLNFTLGGVEIPVGLIIIFLILLTTALLNFLTKEVATISGLLFTGVFLTMFMTTEYLHERRRRAEGKAHGHVEQFTRETVDTVTPLSIRLEKPYRKLVAIRSPHNLHMLEKALDETDPDTTDVVVMTAKNIPAANGQAAMEMDRYDQQLMTAVVEKAEKAGKEVIPLILPTNNPLYAINSTAKEIGAQELILGASNKFTAEEQLDQIALYWMSLTSERPQPITIRILGRNWDTHIDLNGGARIPTVRERQARSVADLRQAGIGVKRALMVHDGTAAGTDLFDVTLTMLDPQVPLGVAATENAKAGVLADLDRANQLDRTATLHTLADTDVEALVQLVRNEHYDVLILGRSPDLPPDRIPESVQDLFKQAPCPICLVTPPVIPREVEPEPAPVPKEHP
jgi:amino acid transporter